MINKKYLIERSVYIMKNEKIIQILKKYQNDGKRENIKQLMSHMILCDIEHDDINESIDDIYNHGIENTLLCYDYEYETLFNDYTTEIFEIINKNRDNFMQQRESINIINMTKFAFNNQFNELYNEML